MGDTSIRVSDETKQRLEFTRREGESYDEVIRRLTGSNRWTGFGVLADDDRDTRDGMRRMREEMRAGMNIEGAEADEGEES